VHWFQGEPNVTMRRLIPMLPFSPEIQHRVITAVIVTLLFAVLARRLRAVTRAGAVAGFITTCLIFVALGGNSFYVVLSVFALASLTTRIAYRRKQQLGTAESRQGRRATQVLANLSVATVCAVMSPITGKHIFAVMAMGALAEAAADTVASECGQAWSDRVYLITTMKRVATGTDGGVSIVGTLCAIVAALIVALVAHAGQLVSLRETWAAAGGGVLGMLTDSLLGATVQAHGWLNNDVVNLVSTGIAAGVTAAMLG
jgi:uncharacterized protein (TIGR00297 family)